MRRSEKILLILFGTALIMMLMSGCAQQGNMGLPGADGKPGTVVTTIQFCPQQGVPSYGHFPEEGVCIDSKIIAAFWDGTNAYLSEVVPGTYISTSTGLQCTFTVANNCIIQ